MFLKSCNIADNPEDDSDVNDDSSGGRCPLFARISE